MRREIVEAFARNSFSISVVRTIKRMSRRVLEENNYVLFVKTLTGGQRITDVVVP